MRAPAWVHRGGLREDTTGPTPPSREGSMHGDTTIFALSTAPGRGALAVFRISGPSAGSVIDGMAGPKPLPRTAGLRIIRDPETREALDQGLVLWFPAPR